MPGTALSASLDSGAGTHEERPVSQALRVNAADAERRRQVEELWQHLQVRGLELMKRRGVRSFPRVQAGFGIAAGS